MKAWLLLNGNAVITTFLILGCIDIATRAAEFIFLGRAFTDALQRDLTGITAGVAARRATPVTPPEEGVGVSAYSFAIAG